MESTLAKVKVSTISRTKNNPRTIIKSGLKGSTLFKSIKENGIQQAIEVRQLNGDGVYELLAGDRRLTSAELLKHDEVPVIIYKNMTDEEAYEKTHFENFAREDLSILEQGKDAQNLMRIFKGDKKAVASKLSIPEGQLAFRLQVLKLSKRWLRMLESPACDDVHKLSIAHLELISRLPHEQQDNMIEESWKDNHDIVIEDLVDQDGPMPLVDLREYLARHYTKMLSGVSWDLKDEILDTEAGSCEKCEHRSDSVSQKDMWDDEAKLQKKKESPLCLNDDCFKRKAEAFKTRAITEAKEKYENLVLLGYGYQTGPSDYGVPIESLDRHTKCKKSAKGAIPAIDINSKIKVAWYTLNKNAPASSSSTTSSNGGVKTLAERKKTKHGQRLVLVINELGDFISESSGPIEKHNTLEYLAALVCTFGGNSRSELLKQDLTSADTLAKGKEVKIMGSLKVAGMKRLLWEKFKTNCGEMLNVRTGDDALGAEDDIKMLSELTGFDLKASLESAVLAKPDAKAWANLNADGTPKTVEKKSATKKKKKVSKAESKLADQGKKKKETKGEDDPF